MVHSNVKISILQALTYENNKSHYFRQNPSRAGSQCSSRDGLDSGAGKSGAVSRQRLESPSLLRKVMGGGGGGYCDPPMGSGLSESPSPSPSPAFNNSSSYNDPRKNSNPDSRNNSYSDSRNNSYSINQSRVSDRSLNNFSGNHSSNEVHISQNISKSQYNVTNGSSTTYNTSSVSSYNNSSILSALNNTSSMLENSFDEKNNHLDRSEEERLTWLQKQQKKLQERREEQKKSHQEYSGRKDF